MGFWYIFFTLLLFFVSCAIAFALFLLRNGSLSPEDQLTLFVSTQCGEPEVGGKCVKCQASGGVVCHTCSKTITGARWLLMSSGRCKKIFFSVVLLSGCASFVLQRFCACHHPEYSFSFHFFMLYLKNND